MATPETEGITTCTCCKRDADAKRNRSGFLYYRCGCGHEERTHNQSSSRAFEKRMRPVNFRHEDEEKKPEIPAKTEKTTPVPAQVPPAQAVKRTPSWMPI